MMSLLVILVGLSIPDKASEHEVSIAIFRVSESSESIDLHITLDAADYCKETKSEEDKIALPTITKYLEQNFTLEINGEPAPYILTDLKSTGDHLQLKGHLVKKPASIQNISTTNKVMLNISDQSNILELDLNDERRDYRMHEERQRVFVEY